MITVTFTNSDGCNLINPKSNYLTAPIPETPKNSTNNNKNSEIKKAKPLMFRQNHIGINEIINIITKPIQKRVICTFAQGSVDPPATENNIIKPIVAIVIRITIIGKFI